MSVARVTALSLLCAAASVSCADRSSVTGPADQTSEVSPPVTPSTRGAEVFWDVVAVTFADFNADLAGIVGFAGSAADVCAGDFTTSNTRAHLVFTPSGGFLPGAAGGRDAPVEVYEWGGADFPSFCELAEAQLIGTGTATFVIPTLFTPAGGLVQTFIMRGIIDLVSGGQARLELKGHATVRPDGTVVLDRTTSSLTPL